MNSNLLPTYTFKKGFIDALPIFFGYLAVGFAFGVKAIDISFPSWSPILLSLTHLSGTGQFAVIDFAGKGGGLVEITMAVLVLNLRYVLMSLSYSQKIPPSTSIGKRLLIANGITDENVALALKAPSTITVKYSLGILCCSYLGWNLGTILGVFASGLFAESVRSALGIALYAMFLAIILPDAKSKRPICYCVVTAALLNICLTILPQAIRPSDGWSILIAGCFTAILYAIIFPEKQNSSTEADVCS